MSNNQTLASALVDVRKAYRLLWSYQRRVYDILQLITDEFGDMSFYYWQTMHAGRPCNSGTNPLNRWTWDMLPMMQTSYLFLPNTVDRNETRPGQWMLEVYLSSDDGFSRTAGSGEPDPMHFEDAANSASSITMYAWLCCEPSNLNWFTGVWSGVPKAQRPEDSQVCASQNPPFKIFAKRFDLADFPDKTSVTMAVMQFRTQASEALGTTIT
ncbi:hypothetical protein [Aminobacter aminovorans]|uniref:hypothetical protein n=1 Tax=Aminobacter aminovorans TaxID=83263 RepID=UPI00285E13CA|nr:hypothetical protein [Aminobacter aminovorans]MDR7221298.1 hypothetical protein [Aminobacter aminovorans]